CRRARNFSSSSIFTNHNHNYALTHTQSHTPALTLAKLSNAHAAAAVKSVQLLSVSAIPEPIQFRKTAAVISAELSRCSFTYEFFGQNVGEEVELGGLEDEGNNSTPIGDSGEIRLQLKT
ncbi:hypothetical protein CUMW_219450, partial [Citrus unshiu]